MSRWHKKITGCPASISTWFEGDRNETLAICRTLDLARAAYRGEARRPVRSGAEHEW
jgi:hypothetical protein